MMNGFIIDGFLISPVNPQPRVESSAMHAIFVAIHSETDFLTDYRILADERIQRCVAIGALEAYNR